MAEHGLTGAMQGAREQIFNVLDQARRDPALARQLQMPASAGNLRMAPALQNMLKTLGISETMAVPGSQPAGEDPSDESD